MINELGKPLSDPLDLKCVSPVNQKSLIVDRIIVPDRADSAANGESRDIS